MFVPVILGSDKTTVSVATGNNEYYPLYASAGNVHNGVRRAHRNAVSIVGFLALPKSMYVGYGIVFIFVYSLAFP
jgi:Plavaka transposase